MERPQDAIAYQEASIDIDASPDAVYDLVSDLPRMGEWSPEATGGRWLAGSGRVGDRFEGTNRAGDREWTRECEVVRAERGRDFTFVVGGVEANRTWWSYEMRSSGPGTTLTEKWWVVNKPPAWLEQPDEAFRRRADLTLSAIETTLAGIKATAERATGGQTA